MATQWFDRVFGFKESNSFNTNRSCFQLADGPEGPGTVLRNLKNGREHHIGTFTVSTVKELKEKVEFAKAQYLQAQQQSTAPAAVSSSSKDASTEGSKKDSSSSSTKQENQKTDQLSSGSTFKHITGIDVRNIHRDSKYANSVIQVASQFNCLEMVGPGVSPRQGISCYASDPTQGPAAALSCPAATIFRNYLCLGGKGQSEEQLNTLSEVEKLIDNNSNKYWRMQNGYLLPEDSGSMNRLAKIIGSHQSDLARQIVENVGAGIQWSTEVETASKHRVCQVFTSATPVNYRKDVKSQDWASFSTLVLEGAFTATMLTAACLAYQNKERTPVFLCPIGGGAFANREAWINHGIAKALWATQDLPIDVYFCHHSNVVQGTYKNLSISKTMPTLTAVEQHMKKKEDGSTTSNDNKRSASSSTNNKSSKAVRSTPAQAKTITKKSSASSTKEVIVIDD